MDSKNKHQRSDDAFERACRVIPGGVNSPARAFGGLAMSPPFIESAKGSKIRDIDSNEYIDYVCSWGPMILGHAHPRIVKAVTEAAQNGLSFGAPTAAETQLAEKIVAAYDSIEKVRLLSSGTEAVMSAVRVARGYTRKNLVIKMAGCYHGHSDSLLVSAGSGVSQIATASSEGVSDELARQTLVVPYNDIDALSAAFRQYSDDIAAVLLEPVAANMGVIGPIENYLEALRSICNKYDALLIFDEVITGFRLSPGGAQQYLNVKPDITCLGKIVGGGMPAAAFGAEARIMDKVAPVGGVYQAGTLSGNPLATAAANATLDLLKEDPPYQRLESLARTLEQGFSEAANKAGIPLQVNRVGSLLSFFFTDKGIYDFEDVKQTDIEMFKRYFKGMLDNGIYLAPSVFEAVFLCASHSEHDIEKTITAAEQVFSELAG